MISTPIKTGDGSLTRLDEVRLESYSLTDGSGIINIGTAHAEVQWDARAIGPEAMAALQQFGHNPDHPDLATRFHLRSFLARSGLDAAIKNISTSGDTLYAEVDLTFLVDQDQDGAVKFPLHEGMRRTIQSKNIKIANLIIIPRDAAPLSESELHVAVQKEDVQLPKGWEYEAEGSLVSLPLCGGQYRIGGVRALREEEWPSFLQLGKRYLMRLQGVKETAENLLRPGFDVRDIKIFAQGDYTLLLSPNTSNVRVLHSASPCLTIDQPEPRHVELRTLDPNVRADDLRIRGSLYIRRSEPFTTQGVGPFPKEKVAPKPLNGTRFTLDATLHNERREIENYLRLMNRIPPNTVHGVIVGHDTAHVIPYDSETRMEDWASVAATTGKPIDRRVLNSCSEKMHPELYKTLTEHPGARALMKVQAQNVAAHNVSHIYVGRTLPKPESMREMAVERGAGIGTFFATHLRELTAAERRRETAEFKGANYAGFSVDRGPLEQYHLLSKQGLARIYWLPEAGEIRKLIGPSFVELSAEDFYRNMGLILSVYCSHFDYEPLNQAFDREMPAFIDALGSLGYNVGIASGASTGLMKRLSSIVSGHQNVRSIGVSTLFYDQVPDLTPPMLTICTPRDRRFRQLLLTNIGGIRLALNGGDGTTGEIAEDYVESRSGSISAAPFGLIDLAKLGNWKHLLAHYDTITSIPGDGLTLSRPWSRNILCPAETLSQLFNQTLRPYINDPLNWMNSNGIPETVQKLGLESHISHMNYMGIPVSPWLIPAIRAHKIQF